jgi:hypothetical protein
MRDMNPESTGIDHIDHRLHDHVVHLVAEQGPQNLEWLVRRARRDLRDARVDEQAVFDVIEVSTLLVPRPTGDIDYAVRLLEGNVLTHRVRADLSGRNDLWLGTGTQPLLNAAAYRPIPLADGSGEVRRAEPGHDALIGPDGWLPDVKRYQLIGLRVSGGKLEVFHVADDDLASPEEQLRLRELLSTTYQRERGWARDDDLAGRPAMLARTISLALLEVPDLFATPYPPLDELLHNPLERHVDTEHWRFLATGQQCETVGFWIDGLPAALDMELKARARQYGMTDAQFIVALLSTLAWRTPFAEDMEPWTEWDNERTPGRIAALPPRDQ